MAEHVEDFHEISRDLPTHYGSHPIYDNEIRDVITNVLTNRNVDITMIENISDELLIDLLNEIEYEALGVLEFWDSSKLN